MYDHMVEPDEEDVELSYQPPEEYLDSQNPPRGGTGVLGHPPVDGGVFGTTALEEKIEAVEATLLDLVRYTSRELKEKFARMRDTYNDRLKNLEGRVDDLDMTLNSPSLGGVSSFEDLRHRVHLLESTDVDELKNRVSELGNHIHWLQSHPAGMADGAKVFKRFQELEERIDQLRGEVGSQYDRIEESEAVCNKVVNRIAKAWTEALNCKACAEAMIRFCHNERGDELEGATIKVQSITYLPETDDDPIIRLGGLENEVGIPEDEIWKERWRALERWLAKACRGGQKDQRQQYGNVLAVMQEYEERDSYKEEGQ